MTREPSLIVLDQEPLLEEEEGVRIHLEASISVEARDSSKEASDSPVEAGK